MRYIVPFLPFITSAVLAIEQSGLSNDLQLVDGLIPRVRAIHTTEIEKSGGSAYLLFSDFWLGYVRGRDLFRREYTGNDGVFGQTKGVPQPILEDGKTPMIRGAKSSSCSLCHNTPFGDGGAGPTIEKNGFSGRNTPHLFGAGLIEMIGWQIRCKLLDLADLNENGFIDIQEAQNIDALIGVTPDVGAPRVSFGNFGDQNGDGIPDLNPVCYIYYVDTAGKRLPRAKSLRDIGVAGYSFEVQVFGWGHAAVGQRTPISSTLRGFSAAAFHVHAGMQAFDPTLNDEPSRNGLCGISLCGAQQFFTAKTLDRGQKLDTRGWSSDDPDRDGVPEELTEGDMDLIEFYLLNHPTPAETARDTAREHGRELMDTIGCAKCHVADWALDAANTRNGIPGDRRSFDLITSYVRNSRLEGHLVKLTHTTQQGEKPMRQSFRIRGVYSDFLYHDLGEQFHQTQFNGTAITHFKTAPLWGVGSTPPYGHDGASLTLDSVIRRHGGEASDSSRQYGELSDANRACLLAFLNGLILYMPDEVHCSQNGENSKPEDCFVPSRWMHNTDYGINLEYLRDDDHDGVPDIRER